MKHKSRRPHASRLIRAGLSMAIAFGCGLYIGHTAPWMASETLAADTSYIHEVDAGETLWEIAGPIADKTGQDVREVIYQLQVNNNLGPDPTLQPGQKLIIRY
jgi:hypothetical protein|nr:MAG TPA: LysM [Caudoviricetes sp.]